MKSIILIFYTLSFVFHISKSDTFNMLSPRYSSFADIIRAEQIIAHIKKNIFKISNPNSKIT